MTEQEIRPWVQALNTAIRIVPKALRSVDALWKNPRVRVAAGHLVAAESAARPPSWMKKASDQGDMIFWYLVFAGLLLLSLAVSFDSLFDVSRMQSGWPWVKAAPLVMLLFWSADHARAFAERARAKVDPRFRKRWERVTKRKVR